MAVTSLAVPALTSELRAIPLAGLDTLLLHRRYPELMIVDLPKGDLRRSQTLVEAIDGVSLRILFGVHPLPGRAARYEPSRTGSPGY